MCGTNLNGSEKVKPISPRSIRTAAGKLETSRNVLATANEQKTRVEAGFDSLILEVRELNAQLASRAATIDSLVARLPDSDANLLAQRDEVRALRALVESKRVELAARRSEFERLMASVNADIAQQKEQIQAAFSRYAGGFLLERCSLLWSTHKTSIGQFGRQIEFPSFELQMSGGDFPSPVRRGGPEQVSESQREFIDLAFRMALMDVATVGGRGSLVIDAPESSLDAVFVRRAADVLDTFATGPSGNRLLITSNLIEGDLIPELMRKAQIRSPRSSRIVDLLSVAAPTAATRELAAEYAAVRARLFAQARANG